MRKVWFWGIWKDSNKTNVLVDHSCDKCFAAFVCQVLDSSLRGLKGYSEDYELEMMKKGNVRKT